jgi:hypothetical protein
MIVSVPKRANHIICVAVTTPEGNRKASFTRRALALSDLACQTKPILFNRILRSGRHLGWLHNHPQAYT